MQPIIFALKMIDSFSILSKPSDKYPYPIYIYALSDKTGIRYIGQTNDLSIRLSSHNCNARYGRDKTRRGQWIKSLLDCGTEPTMIAVEKCHFTISNQRERYWIHYHLKQGPDLVNSSRWGGTRPGAGYPKGQPRKKEGQS
jgi:predicted GIY-YIG superfamily endonuclease